MKYAAVVERRTGSGRIRTTAPYTPSQSRALSPARLRQLSRRSLLKKGFAGGAILLLGGSLATFLRGGGRGRNPRQPLRLLTAKEYGIFAAVAARVCPRQPEAVGWPSPDNLDCAGKVDQLLAELHPQVGTEFRRLLHVFENGLNGLFSVGQPGTFTAASPEDQDRRLEAWRHSRVALFRSGYQAMKRLAVATYYSSPETYALVSYPGPPGVPLVKAP
ncbi:MAG: gluconate 2-dehydrogenase subunit 3 family protein [Polyangia bacterium]